MTMSASSRLCDVCGRPQPFFLNWILFKRRIWVRLLSSAKRVCRYSHDLIAKKMAPMNSCVTAFSHAVTASVLILRRTTIRSAFCFFFDPSWFRYPQNCSCNRKQVLPSASNRGSSRLFARKACATYEMVAQTVPSTRCSVARREKEPWRHAWAKEEMSMLRWNLVSPSR